jgi:hypothetical protein
LEQLETQSARFTDMRNGTIRDNDTGLIWLKDANCFGALDWYEATATVDLLATGQCDLADGSSATDWRLPTMDELWTLVTEPCYPLVADTRGDGCWSEGDAFIGIQPGPYWSSTASPDEAGRVYFDIVKDAFMLKTANGWVWPVRSY